MTLFSQKLYTDYQVYLSNGDTIEIEYDLLSRKNIYKLLSAVSEINSVNDVKRIEDGEKRIFRIIKYKSDTLISEQLVNGYYSLYAGIENKYYITQDTNIYLIEKIEIENSDYIKESKKYIGLLIYLTNNSPEFKDRINNLEFDEKDIENLIYDINQQKRAVNNIETSSKLIKEFSYFGLNTGYFKGNKSINGDYSKTYLGIDFYKLNYYPSFSNNLSFRVGLNATYVKVKYKSEIENENLFYFGIPLCIHAEKTNNLITPYIYFGALPSLFLENNTLDIGVGFLSGFGVKAKILNNINIRTGLKYDMTGWYCDIALEFIK